MIASTVVLKRSAMMASESSACTVYSINPAVVVSVGLIVASMVTVAVLVGRAVALLVGGAVMVAVLVVIGVRVAFVLVGSDVDVAPGVSGDGSGLTFAVELPVGVPCTL